MISIRTLLIIFFSQVFFSCSSQYFSEQHHTLTNSEWGYADTLVYDVDIKDTSSRYNILLEVIHSPEYLYQNFYLKIFTQFPDGEKIDQTLPIDFADHTGRWYGKCTRVCELDVVLQENARFDQIGGHRFEITQHMRENPVRGIEKIGFLLEKK